MKYFLALLVLLNLVPSIALADVLPDNQHPVNGCLIIDNFSAYSTYNFWLAGMNDRGYGSVRPIEESETCGLGGVRANLIAVKKSDQSKVKVKPPTDEDEGYLWTSNSANEGLFAESPIDVRLDRFLPNTNPVVEQRMTVHVDGITASALNSHTVSIVTKDERGKIVTQLQVPAPAMETAPVMSAPAVPALVAPVNPTMQQAPVITPAAPLMPAVVEPTIVYQDRTNYYVVAELAIFGIVGLALLAKTWKK